MNKKQTEKEYHFSENDLIDLLKETFDEGVEFGADSIKEETNVNYISKFNDVTAKEAVTTFIRTKLK